ncbi:MAG: AraC family transcriptional regulator [Thermomicrobium sp.]|nr:AraC family transcriptional regulator [Thermomicrobium sp.]MDW8060738.1 AraC family transcriptional regulator [Thermomicrobium sp.]
MDRRHRNAGPDQARQALLLDELRERLSRALPTDGTSEPLPGLHLRRASRPTALGRNVSYPAFCVIAQGSKELWFGDQCFRYDPAHYLIVTAALPYASRITEASAERPYLSVALALDPALVRSVLVEAGRGVLSTMPPLRAVAVSCLDAELLDAVVRLVRLIEATPDDQRMLAPLVLREIVYRLCRGEQGDRLHYVGLPNGQGRRALEAVERIRQAFDRPLRIEELARELAMSASSLHHQFKAVTGLSPLQFQKQLRLLEARRLLLREGLEVTAAALRVGYRDVSHFSRDYKRLFGVPPSRDVEPRPRPAELSVGL